MQNITIEELDDFLEKVNQAYKSKTQDEAYELFKQVNLE